MTDKPLEYFQLNAVSIPPVQLGEFRLETAAIMSCGLCGHVISGSGGPGDGVICIPCGNELRSGRLRSAVIWDERP